MAQHSRIRAATSKDGEAIKAIYKECRAELGSFNLWNCWDNYLAGAHTEAFVVFEDKGTVVSFIRWSWQNKWKCNVLKDFGTRANSRGKGYGKLLIQTIPPTVLLKCNADNKLGNAFYKGLGMSFSGTTRTMKGVKQNIWTINKW